MYGNCPVVLATYNREDIYRGGGDDVPFDDHRIGFHGHRSLLVLSKGREIEYRFFVTEDRCDNRYNRRRGGSLFRGQFIWINLCWGFYIGILLYLITFTKGNVAREKRSNSVLCRPCLPGIQIVFLL